MCLDTNKTTLDLLAPYPFRIMLSKGVSLSGNYKIVAISTDINTIFNDLEYKADIIIKVKSPPGGSTALSQNNQNNS